MPRYASLHELATVYGVQDVYDMLEIGAVATHNHNERIKALQASK